ncbi:acyl-CoA thioesterase [Neisseria sp. Ec49-e6-T10]|uniref:acyl-CoA thioesterase n=1 Tax=Neisseria sp. Ec49-e6-T10 TaxID=3140744 RepID=UPI003EBCC7B0
MSVHQTDIRVRGFHLDLYQHVNNARYLEFLEEARWDYFEQLGILSESLHKNLAFMVININIDYRHGAVMDDLLVIHTQFQEINSRKFILKQTIYLKDTEQLVVSAQVTFIVLDQNTGKIVSIQKSLGNFLPKT